MKRVGNGGFTLLEILVVIIIIGILAALATPTYFKAVERSKGAEAFINLGTLRDAEARYTMDHEAPKSNFSFDVLDIENPNNNPNRLWDYEQAKPPSGSVFSLRARRRSGSYENKTIILTSDGTWSGNWPWIPGQ